MPKNFTTKPIKQRRKSKIKKEAPGEELIDLYNNSSYAEIQKPPKNYSHWGVVILLAILCGFGAAMAYDFWFVPKTGVSGEQKVFIEKQEDVTVTSEERLWEIQKNVNPAVVNFYVQPDNDSGPFYQDTYSMGSGFILTSDGWIVTSEELIKRLGEKEYIIITANYKKFKPIKILTDPISPIVFIKVEANNLPVAKLGKISESLSGQKVYGLIAAFPYPKAASLHLADLQNTTLEDVVASTEKFSHFVSAREGYASSLAGAPIVNMSGEIIAVIIDGQNAMPMEYLKTAISDLAKKEKIDRVMLGVRYINLAKYPRVGNDGEIREKGALLSGFKNLTAVAKGSPAEKAGLQVGDIIVMVEDELVNGKKTLTQIIQDYNPGDEVKLTISRDGKERVVKVKLQELE